MRILLKYYREIILGLAIIVGLLSLANSLKFGYITTADLVKNKDTIDVVSKLVGSVLVVLGAIASYFRFFRGRVLPRKVDIELDVATYPTDQDANLHAISAEVSNVGTVPIWEPDVSITAYQHGLSTPSTTVLVEQWEPILHKAAPKRTVRLIDTQETEQHYAFYMAPLTVWAVTYLVEVRSGGHVWRKAFTASNRASAPNNSESSRLA